MTYLVSIVLVAGVMIYAASAITTNGLSNRNDAPPLVVVSASLSVIPNTNEGIFTVRVNDKAIVDGEPVPVTNVTISNPNGDPWISSDGPPEVATANGPINGHGFELQLGQTAEGNSTLSNAVVGMTYQFNTVIWFANGQNMIEVVPAEAQSSTA